MVILELYFFLQSNIVMHTLPGFIAGVLHTSLLRGPIVLSVGQLTMLAQLVQVSTASKR